MCIIFHNYRVVKKRFRRYFRDVYTLEDSPRRYKFVLRCRQLIVKPVFQNFYLVVLLRRFSFPLCDIANFLSSFRDVVDLTFRTLRLLFLTRVACHWRKEPEQFLERFLRGMRGACAFSINAARARVRAHVEEEDCVKCACRRSRWHGHRWEGSAGDAVASFASLWISREEKFCWNITISLSEYVSVENESRKVYRIIIILRLGEKENTVTLFRRWKIISRPIL